MPPCPPLLASPHPPGLADPRLHLSRRPDDRLFARIADIAKTAEKSGFDSVWLMDHFYQIQSIGQRDEPMFDAYVLLGAIAAVTTESSSRRWSPA